MPSALRQLTVRTVSAEMVPFGRNNPIWWPYENITVKRKTTERDYFCGKGPFRPKDALSAPILLRPKVSVTAESRLSPCGRNTVAAARQKTPFGRSLAEREEKKEGRQTDRSRECHPITKVLTSFNSIRFT